VWSPFLRTSTLTAGIYLLPASIGGDHPQTHATDELNLMFAGSADFVVDDGNPLAIGPGSLMRVDAGHSHAFENLAGDVVDLIIWPAA
jgi:mannose-6-phosphate isomerase-like protein (cupin superfamily)